MPENRAGYATPPPTESLGDLALAPFRWEYLSRPTTFLPLLIPLYYALSPATSEQLIFAPDDSISRNELRGIYFITHEMVAVGEESFFRGFLNNGLSDYLGPGFGLLTSSAIFGVAHTGTGGTADALSATLFGGYLGFIQQGNEYRIGQGVALHFWWNFLVTLAFLRERQELRVNLFTYQIRF
jgi:membrane protease YdiL (CAAX protease family)